jgi:ribosomal protein S18 acetylase RimI-like enzyme
MRDLQGHPHAPAGAAASAEPSGPDPDLEAIERVSIHFWRPHEQRMIGGWIWRYSSGGSQRANSVATLDEPGMDLDEAIATAEGLYRERGAPAWFQINEISRPQGLDRVLASRGYGVNDPCVTLARPLSTECPAPAPDTTIESDLTDAWFETYASVITPDRRAQARAILERVPAPRAFCALRRNGTIVATALCVALGPIARIKCVATLAGARRTGAGEAVMHTAMSWAAAAGARWVALGVTEANTPARRLYAKLGFTLAGRYHIRARSSG